MQQRRTTNKILSSWDGDTADHLVEPWGPPQSSYKLSDGGHVFEYVREGTMLAGGNTYTVPLTSYTYGNMSASGTNSGYAIGQYSETTTNYIQKQTPIYNVQLVCVTRFTVDPKGIITHWAWRGNNCKARSPN